MNECVLDASVILACLNGEPGADVVNELIGSTLCMASTVNHSEAVAKLCDWGMPVEEACAVIASLELKIIAFDESLSRHCAALRAPTRARGLSLGDRACLALARHRACPAYTADRPWLDIAEALQLDIRCIRPDTH